MTPLERAAKAASEAYGYDWNSTSHRRKDVWIRSTSAALETLMEPTETMLQAATMLVPTWDDDASKRKWQAMLRKVLEG